MIKLFSVLALAGTFSAGFAGDDAANKAAIQKVEAKMMAALKSNDATYLESVLTDDFKVFEKKKTYTKAEYIKIVKENLSQVTNKAFTMEILTIHTTGSTVVLHTKSTMTGTVTVTAGKPQKLVDNSSDEETWISTKNGWKLKKDVALEEKATLDGKPVPNP